MHELLRDLESMYASLFRIRDERQRLEKRLARVFRYVRVLVGVCLVSIAVAVVGFLADRWIPPLVADIMRWSIVATVPSTVVVLVLLTKWQWRAVDRSAVLTRAEEMCERDIKLRVTHYTYIRPYAS